MIGDRWHTAGLAAGVPVGLAVVLAIAVRLAVAAFLVAGPATDDASELAGWDAERFQEIADRDEPAWSGQPVEYPPGSVVILDGLAGDDVVATHRHLVALSVIVDLAVAWGLWRRAGRPTGRAYLLLGLPLVPLGYQRLDTLVTALAAVAALALLAGATADSPRERRRWVGPGVAADGVAATAIAAGALTKIWPAVLVATAAVLGRRRAAVGALGLMAFAGAAWLLAVGAGVDPVDQVLSLRGATGWHVESVPGALVALVGDAEPRKELDAFRIGTLRPGLVTAGRVAALAAMGLLAVAGHRRWRAGGPAGAPQRVLGLTTLGAVAALLVTAPLLSPQFLVWTTPWAALLVTGRRDAGPGPDRWPIGLAAAAAMLTGLTLTAFGPAGLAATIPAALLTARNLVLVALVPACLVALATGSASGLAERRGEGPLGHGGAGPHP